MIKRAADYAEPDEIRVAGQGSFVDSSFFVPVADPEMFTGILGEIVAAAAPGTEADPVGIYASLLAGAGVLVGNVPHLQVGNTRHPLLIWPLLFGRTGSGRKGEATNAAERFLQAADPELDMITASGLSTGEGLIERIRDADPGNDKDEGVADKRLLMTEAEFASVMVRSRRDGSTLAAVLRQAWDGRGLSVLNRKQYRASWSHIAVIGHIAPQEFKLRLADSDMAGGTYNRFLPLFVERNELKAIPAGTPQGVVTELGIRLSEAVSHASVMNQITLSDKAAEFWTDELYAEFSAADDDDQAWTECTRRAAPYCLRIAALLSALDGCTTVSAQNLDAAAALIRYSVDSAKYVLDRQLRDPRLDRLRRAVTTAGPAGLSRSKVSALFSRNLAKDVLDELLAILTEDGDYERFETPTAGRSRVAYRATKKDESTKHAGQDDPYFVPREIRSETPNQPPPAETSSGCPRCSSPDDDEFHEANCPGTAAAS
jgi:Protein of unknown function (DUF3987)